MLSRRRLLSLAGVAGAGSLVAACGPDRRPALSRMRDSHSVRLGVSGEEPFSYIDASGKITGESPEVARAVLRGLGVTTLEAVQRPFGKLIDGLLDGSFDIMAAGMTITPNRCRRVAFSRPDFLSPTAFLVLRGNPLRLHTFADVKRAGVSIGVLDGTVEQDSARAAGIPEKNIRIYDTQTMLFQGVFQAEVPVGALTEVSLRSMLRRQPKSGLMVTAGIALTIDGKPAKPGAGFAFRPADSDLRDSFNAGLAALQTSGQWLRIVAPFGVTGANLPPPGLTTEELCAEG